MSVNKFVTVFISSSKQQNTTAKKDRDVKNNIIDMVCNVEVTLFLY